MAISKIENNSLASGVPSTAKLPAGTVLQVAKVVYDGYASTTSTSYVLMGSLVVTPKISGSLLQMMVYGRIYVSGASSGYCLADIGISLDGGSTFIGVNDVGVSSPSGTGPELRAPANTVAFYTAPSTSPITVGFYARPHQGNAIYAGAIYWGTVNTSRGIVVTEVAV